MLFLNMVSLTVALVFVMSKRDFFVGLELAVGAFEGFVGDPVRLHVHRQSSRRDALVVT
jgi:hypothetical protein